MPSTYNGMHDRVGLYGLGSPLNGWLCAQVAMVILELETPQGKGSTPSR